MAETRGAVEEEGAGGGRERLGAPEMPDGILLFNRLGMDWDVLAATLNDGPAVGGTTLGEVVGAGCWLLG